MRTADLFAKREGSGVSCKKKQKDQYYLFLLKNHTPLSLENHLRTADLFAKREGLGVSCKNNQKICAQRRRGAVKIMAGVSIDQD